MRKGEKLFKYLMSQIENNKGSKYLSPSANEAEELWKALSTLENMTDELLMKIILEEEEQE